MRGSLFVFAVLGACGGGGGGDVTIDVTHDVCTLITVTSSTLTEVQATGIDDALVLWRAHGVRSIERSALRTDAEPALEIRFESAAAAFYGLYDDEHSVIYINTTVTDPRSLSIVIAHELGHSFGLDHVEGRPSLMNPGNHVVLPTAEDDAAVQALWGPCPLP